MGTTPWRELLAEHRTPEEIARAQADARRGCLISYDPDGQGGWTARAFHEEGVLEARASTLVEARAKVHALIRERLGDVLDLCAESLPLGFDDDDLPEGGE